MRNKKWTLGFVIAVMLLPVLLLSTQATVLAEGDAGLAAHYDDADLISSWAYDAIRSATDNGIVEGSGGNLNPRGPITRAEFTKLMVAMWGMEAASSDTLPFEDVNASDWFYPYVAAAYGERLVSGQTETQFGPHRSITRQEMAVMMVRALVLEPGPAVVELRDAEDVAPWARSAVEAIAAAGLMQGDEGRFRPRELATREMAFTVAMRAYPDADTEQPAAEPEPEPEPNDRDRRGAEIDRLIRENAAFMQRMVPDPGMGSLAGEWTVLGLARSDVEVPESYYAAYYRNVEEEVARLMPATASKAEGRLDRSKGTEHSRLILGLASIGEDVTDVAGYDLRLALADMDYVHIQGINGPIFALIAFDSLRYDIPVDAGANEQTTREGLIAFILDREIEGGGWALGVDPAQPDADITAMAIQGLTPYYTELTEVREAVDRGLDGLSRVQDSDGGYRSWGALNAESAAQVVVALSGLGIDADADPRFVKNGHSVLDALLSFASTQGGFYHILAGEAGNGGAAPGEVDAMATDQAMYALVAYQRFLEGDKALYDMSDAATPAGR